MAIGGIGNLTQIFTHQLPPQPPGSRAGDHAQGTGNADNAAATEDTFTPSAQNNFRPATGQEAGIFQGSQGALTAVTAKLLFAHASANGTSSSVAARPAPARSRQALPIKAEPKSTKANGAGSQV